MPFGRKRIYIISWPPKWRLYRICESKYIAIKIGQRADKALRPLIFYLLLLVGVYIREFFLF